MTNPLTWIAIGLVVAFVFRRRVPKIAIFTSVLIAFGALSLLPPVSAALARLWESEYQTPLDCRQAKPEWIVLLPGGSRSRPGAEGFGNLTRSSLIRLERALALSAQHGGMDVIIAGSDDEILSMQSAATQWPEIGQVIGLGSARNTDQAAGLAGQSELAGKSGVWLVTSALHMRRSIAAFQHHGVTVCPYPVDFSRGWHGWFPDHRSVRRLDRLLHEIVGLAVYQTRYWLAG